MRPAVAPGVKPPAKRGGAADIIPPPRADRGWAAGWRAVFHLVGPVVSPSPPPSLPPSPSTSRRAALRPTDRPLCAPTSDNRRCHHPQRRSPSRRSRSRVVSDESSGARRAAPRRSMRRQGCRPGSAVTTTIVQRQRWPANSTSSEDFVTVRRTRLQALLGDQVHRDPVGQRLVATGTSRCEPSG